MEHSRIYLQRVADGAFVEAHLYDEITDDHIRLWEKSWVPRMAAALEQKVRQGQPPEKWPQDLRWDWQTKATWARKLLGMKTFSVMCAEDLQGLMIVNSTKEARLPEQYGKPLMYIEFLSTAPWNRPEIVAEPRYRGVGRTLLMAAVQLSIIEEFKGRVGLHSLPQADAFYEKKCGMTPVARDPKKQNLMYFEMTEEQAAAFQSYKK